MNKLKIIAIVTGVMYAVLAVSLVGVIYHFSIMVDQRDAEISDLEQTKANLLVEIEDMMDEIEEWRDVNETLRAPSRSKKDWLRRVEIVD